MPARPQLRFREAALADVESATRWYAEEAGVSVAEAFLTALERAYSQIRRSPGIGSPQWALALDVAGLRGWGVGRFPQIVFYVEQDGVVEVWRVLHGARDIPARLAEPDARVRFEARAERGSPKRAIGLLGKLDRAG